jgi:hypothetical protein
MKRVALLVLFLSGRLCSGQTTPQGFPVAGSSSGLPQGYPTCLVTNSFSASATDRCGVWLGMFQTFATDSTTSTNYACIDARGEIGNAGSGAAITCGSDPFPVSSDYTGGSLKGLSSSDVGGNLYLPPGIMSVSSSLQFANNQTHVHGAGDGATVVSGSTVEGAPTVFTAASGFAPYYYYGTGGATCATGNTSSVCFSPAVIAFGSKAGDFTQTTVASSPYRQTLDNVAIELCQLPCNSGGAVPVMGLTFFSGQEGTSITHLSVADSPVVGVSAGFTSGVGDGMIFNDFTVGHTSATGGKASCATNSTKATGLTWAATEIGSTGAAVVVVTYTDTPSVTPFPGYEAVVVGMNQGTMHSVNPNGTYRVCAVPGGSSNSGLWADQRCAAITNLFSSTSSKQFAYVIPSQHSDSNSTPDGTAEFDTKEFEIAGFSGREIKNFTVDSLNCTTPSRANFSFSGNGASAAVIANGHAEGAYEGFAVGWDGPTSGAQFNNNVCSTGVMSDCMLISMQWGTVTSFTVQNLENAAAPNTLTDQKNNNTLTLTHNPVVPFYILDGQGTAWAILNDCGDGEMTNGWCSSGGDFVFYLGGVKELDVNGSTGVINAGAGLTFGIPAGAANGAVVTCNGTVCAPTLPGFTGRSVVGASDTISSADNGQPVYYQGSTAVSVSLPTPSTLGNSNFYSKLVNNLSTSNNVSVTPAGPWTIRGSASPFNIPDGQACKVSINPGASDDWIAECHDEPLTAGTNVTITRGRYGPTISASGSGTVGANSTSFANEVAVYNNNGGSTTVNPSASNTNPNAATIDGNSVGRVLGGSGCLQGQQSAVVAATSSDTVFYNCTIPGDLFSSGHYFNVYIVYKSGTSSNVTLKAWLGQTGNVGSPVSGGTQVGSGWTQSSTSNSSDRLDCVITSSTAATCYGDVSVIAAVTPVFGGGAGLATLGSLTTGTNTNFSLSFSLVGSSIQVQLARVEVY